MCPIFGFPASRSTAICRRICHRHHVLVNPHGLPTLLALRSVLIADLSFLLYKVAHPLIEAQKD